MASNVYENLTDFNYLNYPANDLNPVPKENSANRFINGCKSDANMSPKCVNIVEKLTNRQMLGRFSDGVHSKSKTTSIFQQIHHANVMLLSDLLDFDLERQFLDHIYMGFTMCGQYFISYKENLDCGPNIATTLATYELFVWRFVPGRKFSFVSKHKIFKLHNGAELTDIVFMQHPTDIYKLYCYAVGNYCTPGMAYLTILTLPIGDSNCKLCNDVAPKFDETCSQGFCLSHGFILHYMFTMSQPIPAFIPSVNLAYPDHIVINTGHHIHILNISCNMHLANTLSYCQSVRFTNDDRQNVQFVDTMSEASEMSDSFSANSIVEAILEDFSDYDFETGECTKPFHELNISCEPLNITGRNFHNAVVQNIVDTRLKRLQSKEVIFSVPQTSCNSMQKNEKPKIDRKIAEKAYEFTEENEKCEKLSSFRKKRLADKKYEFSEDNSENIVPFHLLRRERRYLFKSKTIKSPELSTLFLSPRSQRSPMQSPNSRSGQFSPAGRNIYCPALRNSPHHSKSPISPREYTRKFNVYSPSLDSDCSDYESKLVLRQINNLQSDSYSKVPVGLLIVDSKKDESQKWIKKVVRRYSSGDFENSSLVSGQSRDDYNMPIEIPILVQTLTDQQLDIVPEYKADLLTDTQLIVTQRSFDCEQFVHSRAQKLCTEHQLQFMHCEDYDIKIVYICPLEGYILCQAVIKIGAVKMMEVTALPKLKVYEAHCLFTWNIATNAFELIEPKDEQCRFQLHNANCSRSLDVNVPRVYARPVLIMDVNVNASKYTLRDYNNHYEIDLGCENENWILDSDETASVLSTISDTD